MAAPQASSSRLEMLQARFQQKQLQEKEQKLLQLYDQQQQRAYQVAQRGSAGSNTSNQGSNMNHQTVTKTTTTTRTTSTTQGGKVRQMFDERRQTTVKGIDRSYPLEPLDNNKSKKQTTNGLTTGKNRNFSKHTITTVKRTARADVNSNVNNGKPVVTYHEEFNHENFGDDEFINENDVGRYLNENGQNRHELLDDDDEEGNRTTGKIHHFDYDKNFHHRVVNDLESEQFPEDLMMEVPDKVGKKSLTKKLSQAELRLERFKNSSSKKNLGSKSITKKTTRDLSSSTKSRKQDRQFSQLKIEKNSNSPQKKQETKICHQNLEMKENYNTKNDDGFCQIFREAFFSNKNENSNNELKSTFLIREIIEGNNRKQNFSPSNLSNDDDNQNLQIEEIEILPENDKEITKIEKEEKNEYLLSQNEKYLEEKNNSTENIEILQKKDEEEFVNEEKTPEEIIYKTEYFKKIPNFNDENFLKSEKQLELKTRKISEGNIKINDTSKKNLSPKRKLSNEIQKLEKNSKFLSHKRKISCKEKSKLEEISKNIDSQKRKISIENEKFEENPKFQESVKILESQEIKIFNENQNFEDDQKLPETQKIFVLENEDSKIKENLQLPENEKFEENKKFISPKRKISSKENSNYEETQKKFDHQKRKISLKNGKFEENSKIEPSQNFDFQKRKISSNQKPKFDNSQKRKISTKNEKNENELEKIEDNIFIDENYSFRNRTRRKIKDSIREKLAHDLRDAIRNKFTLPVRKKSTSKKKSHDESLNLKIKTEFPIEENLNSISSPEKIFERPSEYQEIFIEDQTIDACRKNTPSPKININSSPPNQELIKIKNRRQSVEYTETISSAAKRRSSHENRKFSIEKKSPKMKIENLELEKNLDSCENKIVTKIFNSNENIENKNIQENSNEILNLINENEKSKMEFNDKNLDSMPLKSTELVKKIESKKNDKESVMKINLLQDEINEISMENPQHKIVKKQEAILQIPNEIEEKKIQINDNYCEIEIKIKQVDEKEKEIEKKIKEIEAKEREFEEKLKKVEEKRLEFEARKIQVESKKKEIEFKIKEIENQYFQIQQENIKIEPEKIRIAGKRKNWDNVKKLEPLEKIKIQNTEKFSQFKTKNSPIIKKMENIKLKNVHVTKNNEKSKDKVDGEMKEIKIEKSNNKIENSRKLKIEKEFEKNDKKLERTDSVESALRRFDSIETDQELLTTSKESIINKNLNSPNIENSIKKKNNKTTKINNKNEKSTKNRQIWKKISYQEKKSSKNNSPILKSNDFQIKKSKNCITQQKSIQRKSRRQNDSELGKNFDYSRISTARDSIELARNFIRTRSPSCKRKLFQDSEMETRKTWKLSSSNERQLLIKKYHINDKELEKKSEITVIEKLQNSQEEKNGDNENFHNSKNKEDEEKEEEIEQFHKFEKENLEKLKNFENENKEKRIFIENIENEEFFSNENKMKNQSSINRTMENRVFVSGNFNEKNENKSVSRNARSPSPEFDERKQVENSKTRRNFSGTPSKSPDSDFRRGSVDIKTTRRPVVHSPKKEKFHSTKDEVDSPNLENSPINVEAKNETQLSNVKKICENFVVDFNDTEMRKVAKKPILRNEKQVTTQKESSPNPVPRPSSSLSASSGGSTKEKMNSRHKSSTSRGSTPRSSASMSSKPDYVDNLVMCKNCTRRFTTDRIDLHEKICAQSGQKKRKQFDAMKFRLQGTDLEPFAKVGVKKQENKNKKPTVKSNWRKTHEDFINTIRSAKQVQAHLAAGGKLSDLPPPPPSDTSDYIQCPHCGRKFNEAAAERHIPKCENMRHNKPNPRAPPRPRR